MPSTKVKYPADEGHTKNPPPKQDEIWRYGRDTEITVTKVDPDGQWAMIHCKASMAGYGKPDSFVEWDKMQPLVNGRFPDSWTKTTRKATDNVR